jgi:hypothetical protein
VIIPASGARQQYIRGGLRSVSHKCYLAISTFLLERRANKNCAQGAFAALPIGEACGYDGFITENELRSRITVLSHVYCAVPSRAVLWLVSVSEWSRVVPNTTQQEERASMGSR